jgi:hypothetical protein
VLVDEYDAPLTMNIDDRKSARAIAEVLYYFSTALKQPDVSPRLHFTMFNGISMDALAFLDAWANQLNDISMKPDYAGICGFTAEEFDSLFGGPDGGDPGRPQSRRQNRPVRRPLGFEGGDFQSVWRSQLGRPGPRGA